MRVVLTGFRGTGKTEAGKLLAHLLDYPFLDTDALVEERAGTAIHEIFLAEGEEGFRAREKEAIASLPSGDAVIGTGGGAILDPENVEALRRDSVLFLLQADQDAIEKRIRNTSRPPLTKLALRQEISALLNQRRDAYFRASDFCVDTSQRSANETALFIRRILAEGTVSRAGRERSLDFVKRSGIAKEDVKEFADRLSVMAGNPTLKVYAVAGNPSSHSRSPELFNRLFLYFGINAFYTKFQNPSLPQILQVARGLDARGLSVTLPFKQEALKYVKEADQHATAIGACNTLVFCDGVGYGFNTDWLGIREPLVHREGARAVILGAGGAAAAAVYALQSLGMDVTILNRTVEKGKDLAARFSCGYGSLSAFDRTGPKVVVNTTPVGMDPDRHSLLSSHQLTSGMTIFDLVYTPQETPLIRLARNAGCETITGMEMFIRQARAQFLHFTGINAPLPMVRSALS